MRDAINTREMLSSHSSALRWEARSKMNRRATLFAAAAAALSGMRKTASAQHAPKIRYNAASPQGKAMLLVYADAVKTMKSLRPQEDARAWQFQWFIHATPTSKAQALQQVFGTSTAPNPRRDLATESWYTCQPHQGEPEDYFLPWHRIYVMHLEEIVRALTGDANFTLPYWDYTNPSTQSLPIEFRSPSDARLAPLYVAGRNTRADAEWAADVNAGDAINARLRPAENPLILPSMGERQYTAFCSALDQNLHGAVHGLTGNGNNMGRVPTAAGDPIFWLHHCNIDRIWLRWNRLGRVNPIQTDGKPWADTKFVFADRNGNRAEVAINTVADMMALPYTYDAWPGEAAPTAVLAASPRSEERILMRSAAPVAAGAITAMSALGAAVRLADQPHRVELAPTAPGNRLRALTPALLGGSAGRFILQLKAVQVQSEPLTFYQVYLDLPPNAAPNVADLHFVGTLNFFGVPPSGGHAGHGGQGARLGRTVEFDVTSVMMRLNASGALAENTSVTLVPLGAPASGSVPIILGGIDVIQR